MTPKMRPISIQPPELEQSDFEVLVIGSGYGGSIAAARLAEKASSLCLLERGREILPGEYPTNLTEATAETEVVSSASGLLKTSKNGMMQLRVNDDVHVVLGNGLGGGSLINAGVTLEPDHRVFQSGWPKALNNIDALTPFMEKAKTILGSQPLPDKFNPNKLKALEVSAEEMGQKFERPPINVSFEDGKNAVGVWQEACNHCGDCCSGCNYLAKNTLLMNYLPLAHQRHATIVTQSEARTIAQTKDGRYQVLMRDLSTDGHPSRTLTADIVVVSAGSLGTTEILQRSQVEAGLQLSKQALGTRFSGNGDALGFGFMANFHHSTGRYSEHSPEPIYGIGAGTHTPDKPEYQPGPCITGVIKVNMSDEIDLSRGLVIEEGVAPGAMAAVYPAAFLADNVLEGSDTIFPDIQGKLTSLAAMAKDMLGVRSVQDMADLCYSGPMARTQTFLVMSHDTSAGTLRFEEGIDATVVDWPGAGKQEPYPRDNRAMHQAADAIWATFLPNPVWADALGNQLVTVHPVGGCPMSDDPEKGVVDDLCRVWTGEGTDKHPGLFICDGSVIPTALGINPLLTISAITERAVDHIHQNHAWKGSAPAPHPTPPNAMPPLMAGPGKYVDETLKYLNTVYEMVVMMRLICHEYKVTAVPKLVIAMNKLMTILGVPGGEKIEEDFKFGLAFADNKLDKDLGGALDEIAKRLAAVIGAGQYPVDGKEPLMAMAETLMETFGDISPGLSFDETMRGHVGPSRNWTGPASNAYDVAAKGGESFTANFSVNVIHAYHLMNDKPEAGQHDGSLSGEVAWEHADGTTETLSLTDGTFDLLKQDEAEVECWTMTYTGVLDGRFNFKGVKTLRRRKGSTYFGDVTTLYVDLEPIDPNKDQGHQGVLSLGLPDLATQLSTLQGRFKNARPLEAVLKDMRTAISDNNAKTAFLEGGLFKDLIEALLAAFNDENLHPEAAKALDEVAKLFTASLAAVFGKLIFRTYGGMTAYAYNFPAREDVGKTIPKEEGDALPAFPKIGNQHYPVKTGDGQTVKLYRFKGGTKGPVMMASGFGTTALSYGLLTNETSLLQELLAANYDVWLFDYRSSPFTEKASTTPFTLDDIAKYDWPAAIDIVLQARKDDGEPVKDVQVLGHCVGSMSLQMAMLAGYVTDVRQMVSSQLTVHPVTNWFNQLKSDTFTAKILAQGLPKPLPALVGSVTGSSGLAELLGGLDTIDMNSDPDDTEGLDPILNALAWKVPFPYAEACYSPTCHRIFGIYGPAYMHANLNEATHNAIKTVFGKVSSKPFEHLTLCMRNGIAVNADGQDVYLPHYKRLDMPIHFIAGAKNLEFLPDTSLRTMTWLHEKMPERADLFTRKVYPDYAHMDIFIGKANPNPIFADIVAKFDEMN